MKFQSHVLEYAVGNTVTKRQVFECIAEAAAQLQAGLDPSTITQLLLQRERLGSTFVGNGIAVPHVKITKLNQACIVLVRLSTALHCEEMNEKADLFLALLIPEHEQEEYLPLLSEIINKLREQQARYTIRHCYHDEQLESFIESLPLKVS